MKTYLITGNSGTGKTTVADELRRRGFEVHDFDDILARWRNDETGYVHPKSSVKAPQRTPDFLKNHSWVVPRDELVSAIKQCHEDNIFFAGLASNLSEIVDLFDKVFALDVSDSELKKRINERDNNDWGKSPEELKQTLSRQSALRKSYRDSGFTIIDASQATDLITGNILENVS